jgi:hypothetical protein
MKATALRTFKVLAAAYVGVWAVVEPLSFLNLIPRVTTPLRIAYGVSIVIVAAALYRISRSPRSERSGPRIRFQVSGSATSPSHKTYDVFNIGDEIFTLSLELVDAVPGIRPTVAPSVQVAHGGMFRIGVESTSSAPLSELKVRLRFVDSEYSHRTQLFRIPADSSHAEPVDGA